MANPERAIAALHEFRAMGIRPSLDDFGTGYSSMAYLKILPVDQLKVDRSFVRDLNSNDSDAVLVQSSIDLGHNLGLSVVAEGVEDDATLIVLKTLGADVIQGFYLGRPMPEALLQTMDARAQPRTGTDKRQPGGAAVAPVLQLLHNHLQPEVVEPAERRQVRAGEVASGTSTSFRWKRRNSHL